MTSNSGRVDAFFIDDMIRRPNPQARPAERFRTRADGEKRQGSPDGEPVAQGNPAHRRRPIPVETMLILTAVHHLAAGARAEGLPGGEVDVVANEVDRAVGETNVHAARVIAAGRDVGRGDGGIATVVALVIGWHGVAV